MHTFPSIHLASKPYPVALPFPSPATSRQAYANWQAWQKRIAFAQKLAKGSWQREAHKQALAYYCTQAFRCLLQAHKLALQERKAQA